MERLADDPAQGDPMDECRSDPHLYASEGKDFNVLADIYWVFFCFEFYFCYFGAPQLINHLMVFSLWGSLLLKVPRLSWMKQKHVFIIFIVVALSKEQIE